MLKTDALWTTGWREAVWRRLEQPWDIVVVGGGITGAGILREAARAGLRALLLEQQDFGWGTSSRSSKLVHGGLRYLKEGRIGLTRDSVRERERLIAEGPGLVHPLGFLLANYAGDHPGPMTFEAGLTMYDLLAMRRGHEHYAPDAFRMLAPHVATEGLEGGFRFGDAGTDDARLVLRVIQEAVAAGATALNYAAVTGLLRNNGRVAGVRVADRAGGHAAAVRATVVINATGAWADRLRSQIGAAPRIRPLRGSHVVFPAWRLRVAQAVTFSHPEDHRPIFVIPWEGATLVGTTDVDHDHNLDEEPAISAEELRYLVAGVTAEFPSLGLDAADVLASFAGVRPVVGTGEADPSKESRDHVVWDEQGLLTVTGGKLTTFRLMALDALEAVADRLPVRPHLLRSARILDLVRPDLPEQASRLDDEARQRLTGRYGAAAGALVEAAAPGELRALNGTRTLWAELRWAARAEGVVHLDDLLLRRVRIGLLVPDGAQGLLPGIRAICRVELGWDEARWDREEEAYRALWRRCYSPS